MFTTLFARADEAPAAIHYKNTTKSGGSGTADTKGQQLSSDITVALSKQTANTVITVSNMTKVNDDGSSSSSATKHLGLLLPTRLGIAALDGSSLLSYFFVITFLVYTSIR